MVLLTPGPCMTSESVRQAAAVPPMNHRDPDFLEMLLDVRRSLLGVYEGLSMEDWELVLLGGSGSAAMEAMLSSCLDRGPALVLDNGYYSARQAEILEAHGVPHERLEFGWLSPWDLEKVEGRLSGGRFEAVVGVHHETTTGRLNREAELGTLCRRYGVRLLLDGTSSFGADPIDFGGVSALCSSANKCLHGLPGVSFVLVRRGLAEEMRSFKRRTYYLHLPMYLGEAVPLTPPIPGLSALRQALVEMPESGAAGRRRRYLRQANRIRGVLGERGHRLAVPADECSSSLTVASLPPGVGWEAWDGANRRNGFVLYGCKGELMERFFQVSNMGEVTDEQIEAWIDSLGQLAL